MEGSPNYSRNTNRIILELVKCEWTVNNHSYRQMQMLIANEIHVCFFFNQFIHLAKDCNFFEYLNDFIFTFWSISVQNCFNFPLEFQKLSTHTSFMIVYISCVNIIWGFQINTFPVCIIVKELASFQKFICTQIFACSKCLCLLIHLIFITDDAGGDTFRNNKFFEREMSFTRTQHAI